VSRVPLERATRCVGAAAGGLTLLCCAGPAIARRGCAYQNASVRNASPAQLRSGVVCLINRFRRRDGLPRLREQGQLDAAAQGHTDEMVVDRFFGHGSPSGAGPDRRITANGFSWGAYGEALSTGFRTPRRAVSSWLRSVEHCRILLSPEYRDIGVGVNPGHVAGWASGSGTWTADLALPYGSAAPSRRWAVADGCPY
jgi:uncharacterized protein YkwD